MATPPDAERDTTLERERNIVKPGNNPRRWRALVALVTSVGLACGLSIGSAPTAQAGVYSASFTGSLTVGATLTASSSGIASPVIYIWYAQLDATSSPATVLGDGETYVLTSSELGKYIHVEAMNVADTTNASSSVQGPVEAAALSTFTPGTPEIYGTPVVGKTLGSWSGSWVPQAESYDHQWLRDGATISGATDDSYEIQAADVGHKLSLTVTGHKTGYEVASATSAKTAVVQAAPQASLTSVSAASAVIRSGKCIPIAVKASYQVPSSLADKLTKVSLTATVTNYRHTKIGSVSLTSAAPSLTGTVATTFRWCGADKLGKVTFSSWKGTWAGLQTLVPDTKTGTFPVSGTITSTKTAKVRVRTIVRFRQAKLSSTAKKRTLTARFLAYRPTKQAWTGVGPGTVVTVEKKVRNHWVKVASAKTALAGRVTASWKASGRAQYRLVWAGSGTKKATVSATFKG